ncbi:tryptophan halogenase [Neiella marina]|uniref:Tryptophan halogenase n=1 Tax=Neiella marina TaxID=508461 RepID=A0A8J2XPH5_9GAMM|nr:tryptophan halogenase family protein [Neiella marina]GGA81218.1 tryptophan halogenase [Neiella marina]
MKKIVVLGGGTAGWMTVSLLHHAWASKGFQFAVVESANVPTIGVGEGSTPALKQFFDKLGIAESEWMPACSATFKCGIRFANWAGRTGYDSYFHPFTSTLDNNVLAYFHHHINARRQGHNSYQSPDDYFLANALAEQHQAPKESESFPFEQSYGYHFDAAALGHFLKQRAIGQGVEHIEADVEQVQLTTQGGIRQLVTHNHSAIGADFFVDCSGFMSLLLQGTLQVPFVSYANALFNDAAVTLPTQSTELLPSLTTSTAMTNGWRWHIPLTNRVGNGYVYSSQYCNSDDAELELRQQLGLLDASVEAKHLKMKVGRAAEHWHSNCLAVGLSQGFIEPLEATALMLVQYTVENFILAFEKGNFTDTNRNQFNSNINAQFDGVRDYIVAHYKTSGRKDSQYWRDNGQNDQLSDSLRYVFQSWMQGKDFSEALRKQGIDRYYSDVSWMCLLTGMGVLPPLAPGESTIQVEQDRRWIAEFLRRSSLNFPDHRQYLSQMA